MIPDSLLHSNADELLDKAASELLKHLDTGQDCHAETVLSAFPSLASDPHRALELIVLEFHYRRQLGQNPQPAQWYQRFPHWRELLKERLEGTPPSVEDAAPETAAVQTSPYLEANQQTAIDVPLDAPLLGRHEILEEIDRGGMGVVYRARDLTLDRVVALKVIRSGSFASDEEVRRFYREARAAAQLRHPHIVPIYGMGLYEKQHCFTMALFPRGSLDHYIEDYGRDVRSVVALLVKVARAVQAAHAHGILHRDLKPSNILLDEGGEPVVSDFGLAKRLDVSATLTQAEHPVGTPAYMSPEQVNCQAATAASDIWSLGVILYELLTGRRPFPGNTSEAVKKQILHDEVVSPRRLRADLPRQLETIVLACLEKEPNQRYQSAAALADDLERWQHGEAIRVRPESRWQRLRRHFRRRVNVNRGVLLLIALLLLGAGAAGFWGLLSYFSPEAWQRRRQEQVLASIQTDLAEGKSVVLVPELGLPAWYRYRTQTGRAPIPEVKQWPLKLDSPFAAPLLVELLPDPQIVSYRVSAEVRPDGFRSMHAGLYFTYEELATPAGTEQCFGLFRLEIENLQAKAAELLLVGLYEQNANGQTVRTELEPAFTRPFKRLRFVLPPPAAGEKGRLWRRIEVQVTPLAVQAFCDGRPMGDFALADVQQGIARRWRASHRAGGPVPTFPLRGGLGLYMSDGPAYFRNVVIAPLPQP